jgi:3D (Asp-Asp-Asp) domain-containing protein
VSIAVTSALALGLFLLQPSAVRAEAAAAGSSAPVPQAVTLTTDGDTHSVSTSASSVSELLAERGIRIEDGDFVSAPLDMPLAEGMKVEFRHAVTIEIFVGKNKRTVRSSAATIADLLAEQRIGIGPEDEVTPPLNVPPLPHDVVHVTRVDSWTLHERESVAPQTRERTDTQLALGTTRTIDPGRSGLRATTVRFVRRDGGKAVRTVLASRIIRSPRPRVVVRGIAEYASLAHVAEQGFTSALHFAGSALHMIATAYTAGCYGCSGFTATGSRAGFGVIAVDPNVIPLGTRLFIPGYGRAVAGDTGGAIRGHRVDLGMNTVAEALRFGRRPITVYVLR